MRLLQFYIWIDGWTDTGVLGKKIEGKEMKLIAVTILFHPLLILGFSALALSTHLGTEAISNSGFHGLTQVVYEYTSSAANNGSGFEGLADNTPFWNITTGLVMFLGRYFSLITMLAVAASLKEDGCARNSRNVPYG